MRQRFVAVLAGLVGLVGAPLAVVVLSSTSAGAAGPGCQAGDIEVTANTDAAIRLAFTTASGLAGPQTICVDSTVVGPITLTGGALTYNAGTTPALTLEGNGITISGGGASEVINDTTIGPLTLDRVTITGGHSGVAGGVSANGALTVTNSTVSGSTATTGVGGGLFAAGALTLTNSTVSGNTAPAAGPLEGGGGIDAEGTATITNSTVSGNSASGAGGGIVDDAALTLTNSTVSGNTAPTGGGIDTGTLTATNSTVAGNTGATSGGGVSAIGAVTLVYTTIAGNSSPAGSNLDGTANETLTSFGSVLASPQGGGANCVNAGPTTSHGFNLEDDAGASCGFSTGTSDLAPGTAANLGALGNNGGSTQTQLPQPGSALIDGVPASSCQADGASGITSDQRGLPRPDSASPNCDVGAVEVQPAAPAPPLTAAFTG